MAAGFPSYPWCLFLGRAFEPPGTFGVDMLCMLTNGLAGLPTGGSSRHDVDLDDDVLLVE